MQMTDNLIWAMQMHKLYREPKFWTSCGVVSINELDQKTCESLLFRRSNSQQNQTEEDNISFLVDEHQ